MVLAPAPCVSWGGGGGGKEEDVEESRGLDVDYWAQSAIFAFALGDAVAIRVSCSSAVCALLVLWQFVAQYVRGPWIRFWVWIASHFHVRFSWGGGGRPGNLFCCNPWQEFMLSCLLLQWWGLGMRGCQRIRKLNGTSASAGRGEIGWKEGSVITFHQRIADEIDQRM